MEGQCLLKISPSMRGLYSFGHLGLQLSASVVYYSPSIALRSLLQSLSGLRAQTWRRWRTSGAGASHSNLILKSVEPFTHPCIYSTSTFEDLLCVTITGDKMASQADMVHGASFKMRNRIKCSQISQLQ